jgi:guanosine-3',5'-bis(diphosphate) 3'-pyrophosphohydrolase
MLATTMSLGEASLTKIFAALRFAAERHLPQRRKGDGRTPYINHPISVFELLWRVGGVRDPDVLAASLLHDTVEDTETTLDEIGEMFGPAVRSLVAEISDEKTLPKSERKRLQIERAPSLSQGAKLIRLADKSLNVYDVAHAPPAGWSYERRAAYLTWAERVVAGMRGCNAALEMHYDGVLGDAWAKVSEDAARSPENT